MQWRPFEPDDVSPAVALWNTCLSEHFPMDERLFRQNTLGCPHFDTSWTQTVWDGSDLCALALARRVREPMGTNGMAEDRAWLTALLVHPAHQRKGLGTRLHQQMKALAGERRFILGGDPSHFFPGVPPVAAPFFQGDLGPGVAWDLLGILDQYALPEDVPAVKQRAGVSIGPCTSADALDTFLAATFPGRWRYDTARRMQREPSPQDVLVVTRADGTVVGFSHTFHSGSAVLGPSVYWRGRMGEPWGGLGPIGVAEAVRGQGLGRALLHRCIDTLKQRGVRRMGIDWTVLLDFYGQAGFQPWREYRMSI